MTMDAEFYKHFEDRFRGRPEVIRERLSVYLPFIEPLKAIHGDGGLLAVDLGCGRGEFLKLLQENGLDATGVDLDDAMLESCRTRGLTVHKQDAVSFLQGLPDESQVLISSIHMVEHIPPGSVMKLVQEALRVLKPGGLMILETPNPENIRVGTADFYLDPTHVKPLPPPLLAFLPEYAGFEQVKIVRLQGSREAVTSQKPDIIHLFNGVSRDYAVIARKPAGRPMPDDDPLKKLFNTEFGLILEQVATAYNHTVENSMREKANEIAEERLMPVMERVEQAQIRMERAQDKLANDLNQDRIMVHRWKLVAEDAQKKLDAVYTSYSWRVTKPLRWVLDLLAGRRTGGENRVASPDDHHILDMKAPEKSGRQHMSPEVQCMYQRIMQAVASHRGAS